MSQAGREFDHLADGYDRYRPEYPHELMRFLAEHIEAGNHPDPAVVADVGSGTGIATRLLHRHLDLRYLILGVEPGEGMRLKALQSTPDAMEIEYLESAAEDMPFDDNALCAVMVAQALQWFDRPRFYIEVCRVLRPAGTLAILQNNRDWQASPFLDEYETFMETNNPAYSRNYRAFDIEAELAKVNGLEVDQPLVASWDREMSVDEFIGMAMSSSRLQQVVSILGELETVSSVRDLAGRYVDESALLQVRYRSELYLARRESIRHIP
jgi:ubiquinone/menaquinone biosynthesis C-methylase UbiE